ncbi:hypothetical protein EW026_g4402 [Hermanssonia centrifuga]|uniref:Uncharacterized protein n=1 Tax=Hermanssonia centrifuga TaxID=98765 RepID=A0A4S4KH68_9APHY|nr:hypothetical protein EW026_g4402 [Hermanssonia centrifuga]
MSRHNPIFPTDDLVLQTDAALPSSVSSTSQIATGHSYIDGLSRAHAKLAAVPQELCDSPCPASESHVDLIRDKTRSALKYANHDPSDAKWSHVARILRMASTSRKYRGIAEGVRAGEVKNVEVGDYKWVLPATEAEWADCEKRWKQRSLTAVGPTRASRYWADSGNKVAEQDAQAGTPSKAALVRHKVKQWQATVLPATQGSLLPPSGDQLLAKKAESGKEKEGEPKRQSPLTFPVTKRSAVAGSKINVVGEPLAQYPHDPPAALQITDLSEMSHASAQEGAPPDYRQIFLKRTSVAINATTINDSAADTATACIYGSHAYVIPATRFLKEVKTPSASSVKEVQV